MTSYQSYIICTSPRSGSTLLCKMLAATGKSGKPESYFHNPSISDWLSAFDLSTKHFAGERKLLDTIFDAVRERGAGDTGVFGLRLQRKSFGFLIQELGVLYPGLSSDAERFQAAFGNTLFIHLTRANKLEQAISFVKATQSGLWHRAPDGTELERLSEPKELIYNADEISRHIMELSALDNEWHDWFAKEKISRLHITYDELSTDPEKVQALILDRLGVDREAAKGVTPAVAKLADATSQSWVERFLAETKTE